MLRKNHWISSRETGWSCSEFCTKVEYNSLKPYIAITDKTRKKMMETNF